MRQMHVDAQRHTEANFRRIANPRDISFECNGSFLRENATEPRGNNRKDRPSLLRLSGFIQSAWRRDHGWHTARTGRPWDAIVAICAHTTTLRLGPNVGEPCVTLIEITWRGLALSEIGYGTDGGPQERRNLNAD